MISVATASPTKGISKEVCSKLWTITKLQVEKVIEICTYISAIDTMLITVFCNFSTNDTHVGCYDIDRLIVCLLWALCLLQIKLGMHMATRLSRSF